jgi:hypothetical protein
MHYMKMPISPTNTTTKLGPIKIASNLLIDLDSTTCTWNVKSLGVCQCNPGAFVYCQIVFLAMFVYA